MYTAQDTQPSKEQTEPHPLCDEMRTPDNTLSPDLEGKMSTKSSDQKKVCNTNLDV